MYDAACPSDPPILQRATGALSVSFKRRGDATVLDGLRQEGCLKARFPRVEPTEWATTVTLNSSGGIAAGDRLTTEIGVGQGASACVAAQAAERFYRALPGSAPSTVRTRLAVADGAAAEWLPQETILFDRSALDRRLEVELAPDAWFLGVESLVFGRAAMGERVERASLRDLIRVRRAGTLLLHDAIRLDGDVDALLQHRGVAGGARALATVVHVAPDAERRLDAVRDAIAHVPPSPLAGEGRGEGGAPVGSPSPHPSPARGEGAPACGSAVSPPLAPLPWSGLARPSTTSPHAAPHVADGRHKAGHDTWGKAPVRTLPVEAAASAWNGLLLARVLAPDGASLRRAVTTILAALRDTRPLPRVWLC